MSAHHAGARGLFRRVEFWGILLRLVLLPLGSCWDLWINYTPSHTLVYHHQLPWHLWGGAPAIHPIVYVHAAWLAVLRHLFGFPDVWNDAFNPLPADPASWVDVAGWEGFLRRPGSGLMLAGLKVPYLVCELLMIALLTALPQTPEQRRRASAFLWLNPMSLYLVSLFGCWDVFPALFVTLTFVALAHRRPYLASLSLGLAAVLKLYPLLFLPFLLVLEPRTSRARWVMALCVVGPVVLWQGLACALGIPIFDVMLRTAQMSFPLSLSWTLGVGNSRLYPFVIGYTLLCLHALYASQTMRPRSATLAIYSLSALLVFFSFSFFHVQYVFWSIPLFALCLPSLERWRLCFAIQVLGFLLYTLEWGKALTIYLIAGINPTAVLSWPDPIALINRWYPPTALAGIGHSLLAGSSLWLVFTLMMRRGERATSR